MASVSVSAVLPASPEKTWDALSDLSRWEEWLTIHQAGRVNSPPRWLWAPSSPRSSR